MTPHDHADPQDTAPATRSALHRPPGRRATTALAFAFVLIGGAVMGLGLGSGHGWTPATPVLTLPLALGFILLPLGVAGIGSAATGQSTRTSLGSRLAPYLATGLRTGLAIWLGLNLGILLGPWLWPTLTHLLHEP